MKNQLLFSLISSILILSCGSKEEKMLKDYINDKSISSINIGVDELNLKIINLSKIGEIKSRDSLNNYNILLSQIELEIKNCSKDKQKYLDELESTKAKMDSDKRVKAFEVYNNIIEICVKQIELKKEELEIHQKSLNKIKNRIDYLNANPEAVIGYKYNIIYSMLMPDSKFTNTIKVIGISNSDDTKFLKLIEN